MVTQSQGKVTDVISKFFTHFGSNFLPVGKIFHKNTPLLAAHISKKGQISP